MDEAMNAKKMKSGWLAVGVLLLGSAVGLAVAGEEPSKKEQKLKVISGDRVFLDGRSWLGVQISDVTAERARELKLAGEYGVVIEEVEEESPAAKAGFQAKDVILSFADERVRSAEQLRRLVRETPAGRTVPVQISRDGQTRTLQVALEAHQAHMAMPGMRVMRPRVVMAPPAPPATPAPPGAFWVETPELDLQVFTRGPMLGISGDELTPQLAEYFGVKSGKGVLVREVMAATAADKAGLKAGDVIIKVEGDAVATLGELRRALRKKREGKQVSLTIVRNRAEQNVSVELDQPQSRGPERVTDGMELQFIPEDYARFAADLAAHSDEWRQAFEEELAGHQQEWQEALHESQEEIRRAQEEWQRLHQQDWEELEKELRQFESEIERQPARMVI
ncbi:MAG: PDZ domain-containing protein [Candidatus Acidiferrales bacterium]